MLDFLGKRLEDITGMDLRYYYGVMRERRGIKMSTMQTRLHYLSSFWDFMITEDMVSSNPVKKVGLLKIEKTIKKPFSAAEMDRFGTASLVTRSTSDITNVQNFLTLLLRVGLLAPMMAAAGLVFSAATGGEVSSVLLVAIPVLLTVLTIIMVLASKYSIRLRKKLDQINRLFLES